MASNRTVDAARRGFTLVELLVVISIMLVLTVVVLPALGPATEGRRIREAARAVDIFFGAARNQAVEIGRPCGVLFQRTGTANGLPNACQTLYQVEVPPPYSGDIEGARIRIVPRSAPNPLHTYNVQFGTLDSTTGLFVANGAAAALWNSVTSNGDLLQLNHQGNIYRINFPITGNKTVFFLDNTATPGVLDWPGYLENVLATTGLPFNVHRQPRPTLLKPLQLPGSVAIDLAYSGGETAANATLFQAANATDTNPVIIMFSPSGSLDRVYWTNLAYARPTHATTTESLYLLIGKLEQVGLGPGNPNPPAPNKVDETTLSNWQLLSNYWVAVRQQTGMISTAPNAMPATYDHTNAAARLAALLQARQYAQGAETMEGR